MDESLKDEARQFALQQHSLFGDIIVGRRINRQESPRQQSESSAEPSVLEREISGIAEDWTGASSLDSMNQMICACVKCPLGHSRNKFVFGVGNPNADIVVIGEGPGADEDATGEPFVGQAGQLLNKILEAIHMKRDDVYICNIVKCRPPGNRTPERYEIEQCKPYLLKQLDLIKPRFILTLGLTATNTILDRKDRMGQLRGKPHQAYGMTVIATYHPAALLRNPQWKRATWEDVQLLRRLYDEWKAS
jgi:uracil-DNA glycosylase family 4